MKNILIIHSGGNVNSNPNLYELVMSLLRRNFCIYYCFSFQGDKIYTQIDHPGFKIIDLNGSLTYEMYQKKTKSLDLSCDLIIGIDKAIQLGYQIAEIYNTPLAFVSYEIYFRDEYEDKNEYVGIQNPQKILFGISQDFVRAKLISIEYGIPFERILQIPVSLRSGPKVKSRLIHDLLEIPYEKKVALYSGTLVSWSQTMELIKAASKWGNEWVLVLHSRLEKIKQNIIKAQKKYNRNVYLNSKVFTNFEQLNKFVSSADMGIGFYRHGYNYDYEGKNLFFMGYSSGKLLHYLRNGVPVITNYIGQLSEDINNYNLGGIIQNPSNLTDYYLNDIYTNSSSQHCLDFYNSNFAYENFEESFIESINKAMHHLPTEIHYSIKENHTNSLINQNCLMYNEARLYFKKSTFYYANILSNPIKHLKTTAWSKYLKNFLIRIKSIQAQTSSPKQQFNE